MKGPSHDASKNTPILGAACMNKITPRDYICETSNSVLKSGKNRKSYVIFILLWSFWLCLLLFQLAFLYMYPSCVVKWCVASILYIHNNCIVLCSCMSSPLFVPSPVSLFNWSYHLLIVLCHHHINYDTLCHVSGINIYMLWHVRFTPWWSERRQQC